VEISGALETQRFEIQLQNFTTGQQVLPGLAFTYRDKDRQVKSVKTPEVNVRVEMVPPGPQDKGDIRGIKGVLGPVALSPLWWWLLAFAVLATAVALWSERRRKMKGPPPPPPVPADTVALEKLQTLLTSGLIEESKIKEFYSGLSDAVRGYIETGFECPALERTTGELMRDLRRRSLFASDKQVPLNQLLEECDLVKFAKFRPEAESCLKAHALAVQFVEQTRAALNKEESAR
jgi:hypothetical protein